MADDTTVRSWLDALLRAAEAIEQGERERAEVLVGAVVSGMRVELGEVVLVSAGVREYPE